MTRHDVITARPLTMTSGNFPASERDGPCCDGKAMRRCGEKNSGLIDHVPGAEDVQRI